MTLTLTVAVAIGAAIAWWATRPIHWKKPRKGPNAGKRVVVARRYEEWFPRLRRQTTPAGPCHNCGGTTHNPRGVVIDRGTGRRIMRQVCNECLSSPRFWERQDALRLDRSQRDWTRPIPDQYPGPTRSTLRAFLDSEAEEMLVEGPQWTASALQATIMTLGFDASVYAEIRSSGAFLRRVKK